MDKYKSEDTCYYVKRNGQFFAGERVGFTGEIIKTFWSDYPKSLGRFSEYYKYVAEGVIKDYPGSILVKVKTTVEEI